MSEAGRFGMLPRLRSSIYPPYARRTSEDVVPWVGSAALGRGGGETDLAAEGRSVDFIGGENLDLGTLQAGDFLGPADGVAG